MGRSRLDLHTDSKVLEDFSSFHSNNRDFISFNNKEIKQKQDNQIISKIRINTDDSLIYEKKIYLEELKQTGFLKNCSEWKIFHYFILTDSVILKLAFRQ